jgi:hypothetical protein
MIEAGIPCNLYTTDMNTLATVTPVYGWDRGIKCANLVNLSLTIRMQLSLDDLGSPWMKSIDIVS